MSPVERVWPRRLAMGFLLALAAIALFPRFLAWDRPIVLSLDGQVHVFANLIDYDDLHGLAGDGLRARMARDDWALWPPVPHHPDQVRSSGELLPLAPPSSAHWLGTDDRGRDVVARLIHGTRATALIAAGAALAALAVGLALALVAGWSRSRQPFVDLAVVTACDAVAAMPAVLVVVAARGLVGQASLAAVIALIAVPRAADTARIARGALIAALAQPYCAAARALGASRWRVLMRHALPQARAQLAVAVAITAATAVLAEAALGFLGFGNPPPAASWGELLEQAHANGLRWNLLVPPGLLIALSAGALGALAHGEPAPQSSRSR